MSNEMALLAQEAEAADRTNALVAVEQSRAVQEVQAALVIAKRFPRDEIAASNRIMVACQRKSLAEQAVYAYPRGGQKVTGPSIRLAEVLARYWGNIEYGMRELSSNPTSTTMEVYAWDKETNTMARRTFDVPRVRWTKKGPVDLLDPRDIYEMNANQGARRMRACILEIVPGHIVEEAMGVCNQTMAGNSNEPLEDRARKMVKAFGEFGVTQAMIEARLGHKVEAMEESQLVGLRQIYQSIKDGMSGRDDWFDVTAAGTKEQADKLKEKLKKNKQSAKNASKAPEQEELSPETIVKRLAELKAPELFIDAARDALTQATPEELKQIHEGLLKEIPDMVPLESLVERADTLPDKDGPRDQQGNLL